MHYFLRYHASTYQLNMEAAYEQNEKHRTYPLRSCAGAYITQRNMNILVVGGSGSGKTRFFCKPGVYSANCSYLITDPKGELLRASGGLLKNKGYDVKVFNLIDPSQSDCYNPFVYVHNEKDVLTLIDNLIKNTTPRNASSNDPFWESATRSLTVKSQRTNNKIPLFG